MPIHGVSNISNVPPQMTVIGVLQKGETKQQATGSMPKELPHWNFSGRFPGLDARFTEIYGENPTWVIAALPYGDYGNLSAYDRNWDSWIKAYEHPSGRLLLTCDGCIVIDHVSGSEAECLAKGQGKICDFCKSKNAKMQGKLFVILSAFMQTEDYEGVFGVVEIRTTSEYDHHNISRQLARIQDEYGTLRSVPLIIERVPTQTNNPHSANAATKYLISIREHPEFLRPMLRMDAPIMPVLSPPVKAVDQLPSLTNASTSPLLILPEPEPEPESEVLDKDDEQQMAEIEGEGEIEALRHEDPYADYRETFYQSLYDKLGIDKDQADIYLSAFGYTTENMQEIIDNEPKIKTLMAHTTPEGALYIFNHENWTDGYFDNVFHLKKALGISSWPLVGNTSAWWDDLIQKNAEAMIKHASTRREEKKKEAEAKKKKKVDRGKDTVTPENL